MERMFDYFQKYHDLTDIARNFLERQGRIKCFQKNSYYKFPAQTIEKWNFVIKGAVAVINFNTKKETIDRLYTVNSYFSGTKHAFSKTTLPYTIKFIRTTVIYEISNSNFQCAVNQFPEVKNIYLILKQQELNYYQSLIRILRSPNLYKIKQLAELQPILYRLLTINEKMSYLRIANYNEYYKALYYHLKN